MPVILSGSGVTSEIRNLIGSMETERRVDYGSRHSTHATRWIPAEL